MTIIIIVNHNGHEDTIECLQSLLTITYREFYVIIVDNSDTNESASNILAWFKHPYIVNTIPDINTKAINFEDLNSFSFYDGETFLHEKFGNQKFNLIKVQNNGFAAASNAAMAWAMTNKRCSLFWLLNNDTVIHRDSLKQMEIFLSKNNKVGISGSVLLEYHSPEIIQAVGGKYSKFTGLDKPINKGILYTLQKNKKVDIDYPIGASLFVKRQFVEEVGKMYEGYFLYFEELDWVTRGQSWGWSTSYAESSIVWHKGGSSINSKENSKKSKLSDYFGIRNRILFTKKFHLRYLPFVYLTFILVLFNRIIRNEIERIPTIIKLCINPSISNKEILKRSKQR